MALSQRPLSKCDRSQNTIYRSVSGSLVFIIYSESDASQVTKNNSPGLGGSTPVPIEKRVSVWLETVTALLDYLSISHVVPVSHSAGTIYLLNLLVHKRDLLWPQTPIAMLLGEWQ